MKEFNFWCKENTDHGECANKLCDYDNCCCYARCEECIFYLTDSPVALFYVDLFSSDEFSCYFDRIRQVELENL